MTSPILRVSRQYHFEAAHWLPRVPDTHKCKRMHGHNYRLEVTLTGPTDNKGWLMDFWDMDKVIQPLVDEVDHRLLNEIKGLDNPTAENITCWFFYHLEDLFRPPIYLIAVSVWEVEGSKAVLDIGQDDMAAVVKQVASPK